MIRRKVQTSVDCFNAASRSNINAAIAFKNDLSPQSGLTRPPLLRTITIKKNIKKNIKKFTNGIHYHSQKQIVLFVTAQLGSHFFGGGLHESRIEVAGVFGANIPAAHTTDTTVFIVQNKTLVKSEKSQKGQNNEKQQNLSSTTKYVLKTPPLRIFSA